MKNTTALARYNSMRSICEIVVDAIGSESDAEKQKEILKEIDYENIKSLLEPMMDQVKSDIGKDLMFSRDVLYGVVLSSMEYKIDFHIKGIVDIVIDKDPLTIKINPLYSVNYTLIEFKTLIVHETYRILAGHPMTYADHNPLADTEKHEQLMEASDVSASSIVQNDIRLGYEGTGSIDLKLPKDVYTNAKLSKDINRRTEERQSMDYYYMAVQRKPKKKNPPNIGNGDGQGQGQGNGQGQGQGQGNGNSSGGGNGMSTPKNNTGQTTHQWTTNDPDKQRATIQSFVQQTLDAVGSKDRGYIPGSIMDTIQQTLAPPRKNWKDKFRDNIGSLPKGKRRSPYRLNRRQPYRFDLRGHLPDRETEIVIAIDTSGSMGREELEYIFPEIAEMIKGRDNPITIIEADTQVQKVYKALKPEDFQYDLAGRGGTSFTPVIEYINERKEFRNALFVYFTDGYGEYEIPKPLVYKTMWVMVDNSTVDSLSVKEPYGEVMELAQDNGYRNSQIRRGFI